MIIKRVISGIKDWNAIFELENGLFAMQGGEMSRTYNTFPSIEEKVIPFSY